MKALKLTLQGNLAFFKKPDVNTYMYFTYGNIHKVALLGLLGAIMGYKGYNSQTKEETYPEFYEKLKALEVAIVPKCRTEGDIPGVFGKKVQTFNNSVGYASGEAGGNLIVKEQWLEKPIWEIYIKANHSCYEELARRLITSQYVYIPYLGKNDHLATIINPCEIELKEVEGIQKINSLFLKSSFKEAVDEDDIDDFDEDVETYYKYEEKLPIALEPEHNQYELASFILTNKKMQVIDQERLYEDQNQIVYFF